MPENEFTVERYTPDHVVPGDRFRLDVDRGTLTWLRRLIEEEFEDLRVEANSPSRSRALLNTIHAALGVALIPEDISSLQWRNQQAGLPLDTPHPFHGGDYISVAEAVRRLRGLPNAD